MLSLYKFQNFSAISILHCSKIVKFLQGERVINMISKLKDKNND